MIDLVGGLSADITEPDWVPFLADVVDSLISLGIDRSPPSRPGR